MNLKELKEEFARCCHPSWLELLNRGNLGGLNRENYSALISKIDIIRRFREYYDSEINTVSYTFKEKEKRFEERREQIERNSYILGIVLTTLFFLISGYFFENNIMRMLLSITLGVGITGLHNSQNEYKIQDGEQKEYSWFLLKPLGELNNLCDGYVKLINNELKEIEKKETNEYIQNMNPYEFEKLVAKVFTHFGYVTKVTKGSGDKGIDINIEKFGEKQIIQCKRYKKKIGTPVVRDFLGTMQLSGIHTGFIVTTSEFSYEVVNMLNNGDFNIKLIDINILLILFKLMNDGINDEDLLGIVEIGMRSIEQRASTSELNNLIAKMNYKRNPYLWKKK